MQQMQGKRSMPDSNSSDKRQARQEKMQSFPTIGNSPTLTQAEKTKLEVFASCIEDLEDSMNRNADSSQSLATKVYWLNVILAAATAIAAIVSVANFFVCK